MAAARSDHHRRQAEDYNEVPVISCGFVFFFTDDDRQLTETEATAVGATPTLVLRDRRSKMVRADAVRCNELKMNSQLRQRPSGLWDSVTLK